MKCSTEKCNRGEGIYVSDRYNYPLSCVCLATDGDWQFIHLRDIIP